MDGLNGGGAARLTAEQRRHMERARAYLRRIRRCEALIEMHGEELARVRARTAVIRSPGFGGSGGGSDRGEPPFVRGMEEIVRLEEAIANDPAIAERPHTTLTNIRERLDMMCGGRLEISSGQGGGAVVKVLVPPREPRE